MESIQSDLQHLNKFIMGFESLKEKSDYDKNPLEKHERYAVGVMKANGVKFDIHSGNENFIVNGAKKVWAVAKAIIAKVREKIKKMMAFFTKPEKKKTLEELNAERQAAEAAAEAAERKKQVDGLKLEITQRSRKKLHDGIKLNSLEYIKETVESGKKEEIQERLSSMFNMYKKAFNRHVKEEKLDELGKVLPELAQKYNELIDLSKVNESFPPTSEQSKNAVDSFKKSAESYLRLCEEKIDAFEKDIKSDVTIDYDMFSSKMGFISMTALSLSHLTTTCAARAYYPV